MGLDSEIKRALESAFSPTQLEVINESHMHAGHSGDDGSGESHWRVIVASPKFDDMSRIARHRAVHSALGPEIIGRLHALAIEIK